jgi:hypothetical protein
MANSDGGTNDARFVAVPDITESALNEVKQQPTLFVTFQKCTDRTHLAQLEVGEWKWARFMMSPAWSWNIVL